jgi:hypothetical protein
MSEAAHLLPVEIEIAKIETRHVNGKESSLDKVVIQNIADSITVHGLLHPITVRPHPAKQGEYLQVTGLHRLRACSEILGWTHIPAYVRSAYTDETARMASLAENAFRTQMSLEQRMQVIVEWKKAHAAMCPKGRAGGLAKAEKALQLDQPNVVPPESHSDEPRRTDDPGAVPQQHEEPDKTDSAQFAVTLAEVEGISVATANRKTKIAEAMDELTPAQRAVVYREKKDGRDAKKGELLSLAALPLEARKHAVTLFASGMTWANAIREAGKHHESGVPSVAPSEDEMTDEEWLRTWCATKLNSLSKKEPYSNDAIFYRSFYNIRLPIQAKVRKLLKEAKERGKTGPYFRMVSKLFNAAHPNSWHICGGCSGTGEQQYNPGVPCTICFGNGYTVPQAEMRK